MGTLEVRVDNQKQVPSLVFLPRTTGTARSSSSSCLLLRPWEDPESRTHMYICKYIDIYIYSIIQFHILYYTILYYTILYYTILYYTILYYTILYYTILYYTILYYTILYYMILYYTILYHTILYSGIK